MSDLETKANLRPGAGPHAGTAFDGFMATFEAFQEANDERLAQIEAKMAADAVTVDKVERINAALDEQKAHLDRLSLKAARPRLGGVSEAAADEHKFGFHAYMRHGDEAGLRGLEAKSMSVASDPDGGYLVPEEVSREVGRRMATISPIRSIATVRQVSSSVLKKPFARTGAAVGWVGETEARPETATPALAEMTFPTAELYAMPAATQTLLDDAAVDVDQWLVSEIETAFAEQESAAFVNGDGVNKPLGFLRAPRADEASRAYGELGTVATGSAGALADPDTLVDAIYALKSGYRQNARFVMNRRTQAELRKMKDADGNYIWQAPAVAGGEAMLMGFPVVEAEDMPDPAAGAAAIAFGDFARGYLVVDRVGVRVLRDPYSAKPYVLFYTTKRVGGGVQDFDAIKLVDFSG